MPADPRVETIVDNADRCGEGPLWDSRVDRIVWTDIPASVVYGHDPRSGLQHNDLVEKEERVAVRQDLFDLLALQGDGHAGVYSSSSVRRRARARWT